MNKIEFEEILKYVGVTSPSYRIKMQNGKMTPVYNFNGMKVFFYKDDAVVQGRIPFEVADLTQQLCHDITTIIDGSRTYNFKLDDIATDDIFKKEIKDIHARTDLNSRERLFYIDNARARFHNRNDYGKYITNLGFHRTRSFLYFLLQERDYILKHNGLFANEASDYVKKMREIFINILNRIDPTVSPHAWMIDRTTDSTIYDRCNERVWDDKDRVIIQDLVNEFDRALNPFINHELEVEDLLKLDRFNVVGNIYEDHYELSTNKKDCSEYCIRFDDVSIPSYINYTKDDDSFKISIDFYIDGERIYINHTFYTHLNDDNDTGEIIEIKASNDSKKDYDIEFNLSYNRIKERFGLNDQPREATIDDYNEIVSYLKLAISHAREKLYNKLYSEKGNKIL
jgi:hypothetical protein